MLNFMAYDFQRAKDNGEKVEPSNADTVLLTGDALSRERQSQRIPQVTGKTFGKSARHTVA